MFLCLILTNVPESRLKPRPVLSSEISLCKLQLVVCLPLPVRGCAVSCAHPVSQLLIRYIYIYISTQIYIYIYISCHQLPTTHQFDKVPGNWPSIHPLALVSLSGACDRCSKPSSPVSFAFRTSGWAMVAACLRFKGKLTLTWTLERPLHLVYSVF